ncbi:hypothetical protein FFLO_07212 [Filobasidium floriforme]|uniref:Uncharacterized protein n=2 Tax=Filobasidium floriforme TaxID=5210 RepID=A0A8K0JFV2_9TREE|nr:hypothetical protein FFLO_07212 [Filobasidium floriforme]
MLTYIACGSLLRLRPRLWKNKTGGGNLFHEAVDNSNYRLPVHFRADMTPIEIAEAVYAAFRAKLGPNALKEPFLWAKLGHGTASFHPVQTCGAYVTTIADLKTFYHASSNMYVICEGWEIPEKDNPDWRMMISALHNVDYDLFAEDADEDGLRNCQGCNNPYPPAQMPRHQEVCADYMAWVNESQANASNDAMAIAPFRPVWQLPKAKNKASGSKSASIKDVKPRIEVKPEPRSPIQRPRSRKTDLKGKGRATFPTPPPEINLDDEWLYEPIVLIDDSSDEDDDIQATEAPLPPRIETPVQARPKSGNDLHGNTVEALTSASIHPKLGRRWLALQLALINAPPAPPDVVSSRQLEPETTPMQSAELDDFARELPEPTYESSLDQVFADTINHNAYLDGSQEHVQRDHSVAASQVGREEAEAEVGPIEDLPEDHGIRSPQRPPLPGPTIASPIGRRLRRRDKQEPDVLDEQSNTMGRMRKRPRQESADQVAQVTGKRTRCAPKEFSTLT